MIYFLTAAAMAAAGFVVGGTVAGAVGADTGEMSVDGALIGMVILVVWSIWGLLAIFILWATGRLLTEPGDHWMARRRRWWDR